MLHFNNRWQISTCWPQCAGSGNQEGAQEQSAQCANWALESPSWSELLLDPLPLPCRGPGARGYLEVTPWIHENDTVKLSAYPEHKVARMSVTVRTKMFLTVLNAFLGRGVTDVLRQLHLLGGQCFLLFLINKISFVGKGTQYCKFCWCHEGQFFLLDLSSWVII